MGIFLYLQNHLNQTRNWKKSKLLFELKWEPQVKHMEPRKQVPVRSPAHISAGAAKGVILTDLAFSYRLGRQLVLQ